MLVATYCRVSTESQRDKQTIQTQKRILADFVKAKGWEIFDSYCDDGFSGTSIEGRPAFSQLLRDADQFDVVAVTDADRLTRSDDPRQRAFIEYTLKEANVKLAVASTGELLDPKNAMHELIHSIKTWIAKEDRKKLLQRMAEGRKTKTLQGRFLHVPPYGYKKAKGFLCKDEAESEIVREIFSLYTAGDNTVAISSSLTQRGYCRRRGGQWCPARVAEVIRNSAYKGEYQSKWGVINCPAIVNPATWKAAQQRLVVNTTNSRRNTQREYLVRGLIYCDCGSKMTAKTHNRKYPYYFCYKGCKPYLRADRVDEEVWGLVSSLVKDPTILKQVILSEPPEKEDDVRKEIERLDKKLGAKQRERGQILRLFRKSLIQEKDVEQQLAEIKTAEEMISRTKEIEGRKLVSIGGERAKLQDLESALRSIRGDIASYTFSQRRELVRLIVPGDKMHNIIAKPGRTLILNGIIDFGQELPIGYSLSRKTAK